MSPRKAQFGAKQCAAEILHAASWRVGKFMRVENFQERPMGIADAIADVCTNNAQGACDALAAMHEATSANDLKVWHSGQTDFKVGNFMRDLSKRLAQ